MVKHTVEILERLSEAIDALERMTDENEIENALYEIQAYRKENIDYISAIKDICLQEILYYIYVSRLPICQVVIMIGDDMTEDDIQAILENL